LPQKNNTYQESRKRNVDRMKILHNNKVVLYNKTWDMKENIDYNFPITDDFDLTTEHKYINQAAAVVFHMPTLSPESFAMISNKKKTGQLWVFWSVECELHYKWQHESDVLNLFDIKATYKSDCDIPQFYINPSFPQLLKNPVVEKTDFINAFISSNFDLNYRGHLLSELMKYVEIHSYGKFMNNRSLLEDSGIQSKITTMSRYKFSIAFENAKATDYITEKIYQPLIAGSVPIYLGAPNVDDFIPAEGCYVNVEAFNSVRDLANYLIDLNHNEEKYQEYLQWKYSPLKESFLKKAAIMKEDPLKKLCRLIKNKLA
jgi:hypothetical protein